MRAKAEIYLDNRPKTNGLCNVKVRVYHNRRYNFYATDIDLASYEFYYLYPERKPKEKETTEKETKDKKKKEPTGERKKVLKEYDIKFIKYLAEANKVISELDDTFTFDRFESLYLKSKDSFNTVVFAFDEKIEQLRLNDQIGTAYTYENARSSLLEFEQSRSRKRTGNFRSKLTFIDITPIFLKKYENWMLDTGRSISTVGIYLRNLRALYNSKNIDPALYPFGRGKYEIPTARNIKKALTIEQIAAIHNYEPETEAEERARDYWMFLYLSNGMNVKDFCLLKWENIKGDFLTYERAKTRNTNKEKTEIQVSLKDESLAIIDKWGQKAIAKSAYIFPHLQPGMSATRQTNTIKQVTKTINKYMDQIGRKIGIEYKVTTYYARHSFATILKRSGADVAMISDLLGHSDIKTTQSYLGSFEDDQIKKQTDVLTAFRNVKTS